MRCFMYHFILQLLRNKYKYGDRDRKFVPLLFECGFELPFFRTEVNEYILWELLLSK
jgi:hypothetical protein